MAADGNPGAVDGQADGQVTAFLVTDDHIVALGTAFAGRAGTYLWTNQR